MIMDRIGSLLRLYSFIVSMVTAFTILTVILMFLFSGDVGDDIGKDRDYAESKIEFLQKNISVHSGYLNVELEEYDYDLIGNRNLLILVNAKKDYEKEDLKELLHTAGTKTGIVFGSTKAVKIDRFGYKEFYYDNIENDSNIVSGYTLINEVGLNSYSYEYIYGYILEMLYVFIKSLAISISVFFILGVVLIIYRRKEDKS